MRLKAFYATLATLALALVLTAPAEAVNRYVRGGASGTNCTDWTTTNACPTVTAAQTAANRANGDVIYVAGSFTYSGGLNLNKATTGTPASTTCGVAHMMCVKKATVADHGTDTGWDPTFGTGQAVFTGEVDFNTSYWIWDGVTGGGPGQWKTNYGFFINVSAVTTGGLNVSDNLTSITARHTRILGNGPASQCLCDGVFIGNGNGPHTMSYLWIDKMPRCIAFNRSHNTTWEFLYAGDYGAKADNFHTEIFSFWIDAPGFITVNNTTLRWSVITHIESTGGLLTVSDGFFVYGNVFYHPTGDNTWATANNGMISGWTPKTDGTAPNHWRNTKIYNNTFIDLQGAWAASGVNRDPDPGTGNEFRNNLVYLANQNLDPNVLNAYSHNTYINTTIINGSLGTGDISTTGSNPVPNVQNDDFMPSSQTAAGTPLGPPYNIDMNGVTRGSSGTWTRGAVEFGGVVAGSPPAAPTGLTVR